MSTGYITPYAWKLDNQTMEQSIYVTLPFVKNIFFEKVQMNTNK